MSPTGESLLVIFAFLSWKWFWIESFGSSQVYYFVVGVDMSGAGIHVDMAVAAPGRACGAVLEELGRW